MDPIDWEAVFWQQTPKLYNFFRYRTGNGQTAQDLTARTMEKAWRYRASYEHDKGAFAAWLFQIARNVAVDHLKAQRPDVVPLYEDLTADHSVEREYQKREAAARLYQLLETLPTRDQEIIALKYGAEMTNRAIADLLGLSESNVGTILYRTIKKLRVEWEVPLR